ncbi:MAG: alpha/beta hydrolase [Rhodospirillales bacterium]
MINLIAIAIGVYTAFVGTLYLAQRQMIYFPSQHMPPPAAAGVPEMRPVSVTTEDGLGLTSWYRAAQARQPTIVYFHGNGGNIAGRGFKARPYLDAGFGLLLVEYRGYGGNPGKPTEQGLYADGRAHLDFLAREGVTPGAWVIYGESLGGGVAVQMAAEQATRSPVGAVVLESPFLSMGEAAAAHYPFIPARTLVKDRFDSVAKIDRIGAPLLVAHGENDGVIPIGQGKALFEAAKEPKESHWIEHGGHNDLYDFGLPGLVINFLRRSVDGAK